MLSQQHQLEYVEKQHAASRTHQNRIHYPSDSNDSVISLGNFFRLLREEKQANTLQLVQDNPMARNLKPPTRFRPAAASLETKGATKERPSLAKTMVHSDSAAPKVPLRKRSDEQLCSSNVMGVRTVSLCPRNERFALPKSSSPILEDDDELLEDNKHFNYILPPLEQDSAFASFCEETQDILMQMPKSRR